MNKRNELAQKVHANAVAKGFYKNELSVEHYMMLVITEVAELIESDREDRHADLKAYDACVKADDILADDMCCYIKSSFERLVKNTKEDEFADVAIRLYDLAGYLGVDLKDDYKAFKTTPISELTFTENALLLTRWISFYASTIDSINWSLSFVYDWAKHEGIGLNYFVDLKMKYNETRNVLHGKKY